MSLGQTPKQSDMWRSTVAYCERVAPPFVVTRKRTQYWVDDDYAFFTDIDVQHPVDSFVLAVLKASNDHRVSFLLGALHRSCPEIWLVDPEEPCVIHSRRNRDPVHFGRDAVLISVQLPSLRIPLAEIL